MYREQTKGGSYHHLRVDCRAAEVGAVPLFQWSDKLGEIQLLINHNQQVIGVDEIS